MLIIEDDRHLREVLASVLREEGHEVDAHPDGQAALASLDSGPKPDAILLDLMMPVMNGWQFRARQLAQPQLAQIPTILMTASAHLDRAGITADDILFKPLRLDRLLATLERFLDPEGEFDEGSYPTNPYVPTVETPHATWWLTAPAAGESCRWTDPMGNWISISLGEDAEIGLTMVKSSSGKSESFESYEDALRFSRSLRG